MNNNIKLSLAGLLIFATGYGTALYTRPTKEVIKTQVVTQTNDVIHDHIHTVVVTVTKPDGTKTTTSTTDNGTVIDNKSNTIASNSTTITNSKPQWKVAGLAGLDIHNLASPVYGAQVEKRLLGPISVGIWGLTNATAGISASLEF